MTKSMACPFCGMKDEACYVNGLNGSSVFQCQWCGAQCNSQDDWQSRPIESKIQEENKELRTLLMESYRRFRFVGLNKNGTLMKKLLSVLGEDAETSYNAYLGGELASDGLLKRLE